MVSVAIFGRLSGSQKSEMLPAELLCFGHGLTSVNINLPLISKGNDRAQGRADLRLPCRADGADGVTIHDLNYFPRRRLESVRLPSARRIGRGGRFLASLLKRKRPANTQPFIPGSQGRPLMC